jgi:hypothetical protein
MNMTLDGLDPLANDGLQSSQISKYLQDSQKRDVINILRSYTGTLDVFCEALQNCIDACELRQHREQDGYHPDIRITVDMSHGVLRFVDNGIGMTVEEVCYFVRPGMTYKTGQSLRGHKGVGATFLAYGYSSFTVATKQNGAGVAGTLTGGRQWVESTTGNIPRPKFTGIDFSVPELEATASGSAIEIVIGNHRDERPNLRWLNIQDPDVWFKLLRLRTPLGGVYLKSGGIRPTYSLTVVRPSGERAVKEFASTEAEFYYPHEFSVCQRHKDLNEVAAEMRNAKLIRRDLPHRISMEFRNLDCLWNIWNQAALSDPDGPFSDVTDEQRNLIVQHDIHVYGCFFRSSTMWDTFQQDELQIRPQFRVISGGLQLASDYMVQGDLTTIPLTTAAGYQANSFIVVHFTNGDPDMGRKVFQPEPKELADEISRRIVGELRRFQVLLKADTGSQYKSASRELEEWKDEQKAWQKQNPLRLVFDGKILRLVSIPKEEQDVIALFHELVGMGIIRGLLFYSTGYNAKYDGLYKYEYGTEDAYDPGRNFWGVDGRTAPGESGSLVVEYKYSLDGLIRDFEKNEKNPQEIDLLICWDIGTAFKRRYDIVPYMIGQEGGTRENFGATHALYVESRHTKLLEVVCLKDFLEWYEDPERAIARQKTAYN